MAEVVLSPANPSCRPSDDDLIPFTCENCRLSYEDAPALILVDAPEGLLRYCTDACAEDAGWTEAVVMRWDAEMSGESLRIVFLP